MTVQLWGDRGVKTRGGTIPLACKSTGRESPPLLLLVVRLRLALDFWNRPHPTLRLPQPAVSPTFPPPTSLHLSGPGRGRKDPLCFPHKPPTHVPNGLMRKATRLQGLRADLSRCIQPHSSPEPNTGRWWAGIRAPLASQTTDGQKLKEETTRSAAHRLAPRLTRDSPARPAPHRAGPRVCQAGLSESLHLPRSR